jgi:hypothetical protein
MTCNWSQWCPPIIRMIFPFYTMGWTNKWVGKTALEKLLPFSFVLFNAVTSRSLKLHSSQHFRVINFLFRSWGAASFWRSRRRIRMHTQLSTMALSSSRWLNLFPQHSLNEWTGIVFIHSKTRLWHPYKRNLSSRYSQHSLNEWTGIVFIHSKTRLWHAYKRNLSSRHT